MNIHNQSFANISQSNYKSVSFQVVAQFMGWSLDEARVVAEGGDLPVAPLMPAPVANPTPPPHPEVKKLRV